MGGCGGSRRARPGAPLGKNSLAQTEKPAFRPLMSRTTAKNSPAQTEKPASPPVQNPEKGLPRTWRESPFLFCAYAMQAMLTYFILFIPRQRAALPRWILFSGKNTGLPCRVPFQDPRTIAPIFQKSSSPNCRSVFQKSSSPNCRSISRKSSSPDCRSRFPESGSPNCRSRFRKAAPPYSSSALLAATIFACTSEGACS